MERAWPSVQRIGRLLVLVHIEMALVNMTGLSWLGIGAK
jgi:hypothetical protein